jgi:hypothetical protein
MNRGKADMIMSHVERSTRVRRIHGVVPEADGGALVEDLEVPIEVESSNATVIGIATLVGAEVARRRSNMSISCVS